MYIQLFAKVLLIVGALNYLFMASNSKNVIFIIMSVFIGLAGLYFFLDRDFYLPFLGPSALGTFERKFNLNMLNNKVKVKMTGLPPNKKIIYWAAGSNKTDFSNPIDAYSTGSSGFANSDSDGEATIEVDYPAGYRVPTRTLKSHIHYRYELDFPGLYSRVYTWYI